MTNIKSVILSRFHAPITKLALSLCAALGIASAAKADVWRDITWGGGSTAETKYWNDASNWIIGGEAQSSYSDLTAITSDGDWLFNQTADVHFNAATEVILTSGLSPLLRSLGIMQSPALSSRTMHGFSWEPGRLVH